MRVLVTGSAGFIGRHVTAELERRGHKVIPFDRPLDVAKWVHVKSAATRRVHGVQENAEAIINLAGVLGTPELLGAETQAVRANILGAVACYDVAAELGIPVVQIGTGHKGQPNPYAITKGCAEDLGLARARWLGEEITVVRAFHVYGPGQLPAAPWGPSPVRKFFPSFACAALSGQPARLHGGGGQVIDPVHVLDVAEALCDAVSAPRPGEVIEAGCGKPVSVAQAAADVALAAGSALPAASVPSRPGEPEGAVVVAAAPACRSPWPHLVPETVEWYRQWLAARIGDCQHGPAHSPPVQR